MIAASLGYVVMKKIAETHVEESYKLAKGIQLKQAAEQGVPVAAPVTQIPLS